MNDSICIKCLLNTWCTCHVLGWQRWTHTDRIMEFCRLVHLYLLETAGQRGALMGGRGALIGGRGTSWEGGKHLWERGTTHGREGSTTGERGNRTDKHSLKGHVKWHVTAMRSDLASGGQWARSVGLTASGAGSEALYSEGLTGGLPKAQPAAQKQVAPGERAQAYGISLALSWRQQETVTWRILMPERLSHETCASVVAPRGCPVPSHSVPRPLRADREAPGPAQCG